MVYDNNYQSTNQEKYKRFEGFLDEISSALGVSCNDGRKANYFEECSYFNLDEFQKCYKPLKNGEISTRLPSIAQIKTVYHDHMREVIEAKEAEDVANEAKKMMGKSNFGNRWGLRILLIHASGLVEWKHEKAYELCVFACHLSRQIDDKTYDNDEALKLLIHQGKDYDVEIDKAWIDFKIATAPFGSEQKVGNYLAV